MRSAARSACSTSASSPVPGSSGTPASVGQRARRVLEAEGAHLLRRRADEGDARRLAALGEVGVLGEEAVARVDRLGARARARPRGSRRRRGSSRAAGAGPMRTASSAPAHVQRVRVGLGVDRDRRDAHASQRAR